MVSDHRLSIERLSVVGLFALLCSLSVLAEPLRDPTRSPDQQPGSLATEAQAEPIGQGRNWRLQAVFIQASGRQAIASGHTLSIGQRIEGVRVLAIEPDHVLLADTDGEFRLRWPSHQRITRTEESPES